MKVRLTRVTGGSGLRTDTVEGHADRPPRVGHRFVMYAQSLDVHDDDLAYLRTVDTSPVANIGSNGLFTTETGSVYRLEIIDKNFNRKRN